MSGALHTIDLNFMATPGVIAAYVLDTGDGLAVVDPGPASTLGALETGLAAIGARLDDLRHILLTHIHLDHAGATGTLLSRLPAAHAYVHGRGAPHLTRPERLLASATQIYGEHMERLWGEFLSVSPDHLTVLKGGEVLRLGRLDVDVVYAPGHAVHHVAYHAGPELFVGDVAGVRLDAAQAPRAPTPPPDIDLEGWRDTIATLRALDAERLHLTHYGTYPHGAAHWDALLRLMDVDAERVGAGLRAGQDVETITRSFTDAVLAELRAEGPGLAERFEFACPPWMAVQGLVRYWTRQQARGPA